MQAQLTCTKSQYCDFVVYTEKEMHVERIYLNSSIMDENLMKAKQFFQVAVLPELLGRWFSRPLSEYKTSSALTITCTAPTIATSFEASGLVNTNQLTKYCFCQQEYGEMVGCDNSTCLYQWFQLECLKLTALPKSSKWYCPECRKLNNKSSAES